MYKLNKIRMKQIIQSNKTCDHCETECFGHFCPATTLDMSDVKEMCLHEDGSFDCFETMNESIATRRLDKFWEEPSKLKHTTFHKCDAEYSAEDNVYFPLEPKEWHAVPEVTVNIKALLEKYPDDAGFPDFEK